MYDMLRQLTDVDIRHTHLTLPYHRTVRMLARIRLWLFEGMSELVAIFLKT